MRDRVRQHWGEFCHINIFSVVQSLALLLVLLAIFAQSYGGRVDVVRSVRKQCVRASDALASQVDAIRIAQADNANTEYSSGVPAKVIKGKRRTVARQERIIQGLDTKIDAKLWRLLDDRRDQWIVLHGLRGSPPFRCNSAIPAASPVQFFH